MNSIANKTQRTLFAAAAAVVSFACVFVTANGLPTSCAFAAWYLSELGFTLMQSFSRFPRLLHRNLHHLKWRFRVLFNAPMR